MKKAHIGMIVYNLVEDAEKELCLGLNQWDGEQWNCFQTGMASATFSPVACADITVNGIYVEDAAVTAGNYLTIKLNVTKAGMFSIAATSGNGYSFFLSGIAMNAGPMTVDVPCQGTPDIAQIDDLAFSGIELASGCTPEVEVVSSVAVYSLNCASATVSGTYLKGQQLTSGNTITLNVTVTTRGSYNINTPITNGVRFSGSNTLEVGTHQVILYGTGTPTVNEDFPITIHANTAEGNNTCSATIPVMLPAMTYAIIGNDIWSWATAARRNSLYNTSTNGAGFGPNGLVKIDNLTELWTRGNADDALVKLSETTKPDIILYFAYNAPPNTALITALATYVNKGGCVIFGSRDGQASEVNSLLNGIFGSGAGTARTQFVQTGGFADSDHIYPIANLPNDPIVNGPFGNLSGRYWGEDNATVGSVIVTALPANSVQICAASNGSGHIGVDPGYSIVWYNESKNFMYFGDSTGAAYNLTGAGDTGHYPTSYSNSGMPQSKKYGVPGIEQYVYNSALEFNAIAWALRKAAVSGINPH
jgi:hypothetical protein